MEHVKGKLFVSSGTLLLTEDGRIVANLIPVDVDDLCIDETEAACNALRLAACWNACIDIPTEYLLNCVVQE